jgi:hypothetical protein
MYLKDGTLVALFLRMVETSGKSVNRSFNAVQHDPTHGENITVYAELQYGLTLPELFIGPPTAEDFPYHQHCLVFEQQECPGPQLVMIEIQSIWADEITVTDYVTGKELMNCYFDSHHTEWNSKKKESIRHPWINRKTLLKPQQTLNRLLWDARFLDQGEADEMKASWYDEPFEDPMGCLADYE